jgi:RNA polymerase sigma-70 factor (ECF subfamily)
MRSGPEGAADDFRSVSDRDGLTRRGRLLTIGRVGALRVSATAEPATEWDESPRLAPIDGGRTQRYWVVHPEVGDAFAFIRERLRDNAHRTNVVIERRGRERRRSDRRLGGSLPDEADRRRLRNHDGRRVADRRGYQVEVTWPFQLPEPLRAYADWISFVERIEPRELDREDADSGRLALRIQAGEADAYEMLYKRYYERLFAFLRVILGDHHEAENAIQDTFLRVFESLPRFELRAGHSFRAWLFTIARNEAFMRRRRKQLIHTCEPEELLRHADRFPEVCPDGSPMRFTDPDFIAAIDRLPDLQRQAITLHKVLGFSARDTAAVLGRTPEAVRALEHRAMRSLEAELMEYAPSRCLESAMLVKIRRLPVIRARRFILAGSRMLSGRLRPAQSLSFTRR